MTAPAELAARPRAILGFILAFIRSHRYAPTIREMQDGLGVSSSSVIAYNLKHLETAGLITRAPDTARGIVLTAEAIALLDACPYCGLGGCGSHFSH